MRTLNLRMELENGSMMNSPRERDEEIDRIFMKLASDLKIHMYATKAIMDINGVKIGQWEIEG